jgi:hypothetical protein
MKFLESNKNEDWLGLCELAIGVDDPQKFRAILKELNHLLEERDQRRRIDLPWGRRTDQTATRTSLL